MSFDAVWIDRNDNVLVTDFSKSVAVDSKSSVFINAPKRDFHRGYAPSELRQDNEVGVLTDSYGLGQVARLYFGYLHPENSFHLPLSSFLKDSTAAKKDRLTCKRLHERYMKICKGMDNLDKEMSDGAEKQKHLYEPKTVVGFTNP